jgi:pyruvate/2-oxoglutarate dehydrogenase complex dihydrolipoamide acyltransferase (E2) component
VAARFGVRRALGATVRDRFAAGLVASTGTRGVSSSPSSFRPARDPVGFRRAAALGRLGLGHGRTPGAVVAARLIADLALAPGETAQPATRRQSRCRAVDDAAVDAGGGGDLGGRRARVGAHVAGNRLHVCSAARAAPAAPAARARPPGRRRRRRRSTGTRAVVAAKLVQRAPQSIALTRQFLVAVQLRLDFAQAPLDRLRHIG